MQFSPSPLGHHILAYNSSRIYVIDVRGPSFEVAREFKILRRPVSACIKDDRSLLAVLSTEMQVDLYDLQKSPPQRTSSIILDNSPRTISLSPCGSVLAAAYEGGIEVSSLKTGALPTDRRAVKCDGVDSLSFSFDGTQLLGTTVHSSPPSTVIITAPYYDPGSQLLDDNISAMWTNSILFPNTSRDCSHAVLLQDGNQEEASWTFTYDRSFETFRAVRIDDLRNGTTYFTGPTPHEASQSKLLPCTPSAATHRGEIVSAGFQGKEIWIYGIPEDLDAVAETASSHNDSSSASSSLGRRNSAQGSNSRHASPRAQGTSNSIVPQWQLLCDKQRNTFVMGRKISELSGLSNVRWVSGFGDSSFQERLVAGARGVAGPRLVTDEEDIDFVDGGRITLLDFDYGLSNGTKNEITIEVGTEEAEVLEEEQRDMETEVAIVRRRTVMQRRNSRVSLLRAATTSGSRASIVPPVPPVPPVPAMPQSNNADDDPLVPRTIGRNPLNRQTIVGPPTDDGDAASIDEQEALDLPYANASPRSGTTLRRAATAVAVNRRYNPTTADGRPIEYRRADGRREHPHESDADNWVPPPPPYQKEDPGDMPAFLRATTVAPPLPPMPPMPPMPMSMSSSFGSKPRPETVAWSGTPPLHERHQSIDFNHQRPSHQRTNSDSTTLSRRRIADTPRPMSTPSIQADVENIYDVSPPDSPRQNVRPQTASEPSPQLEHSLPLDAPVSRATTPGNDMVEPPPVPMDIPLPTEREDVEPVSIEESNDRREEPVARTEELVITSARPSVEPEEHITRQEDYNVSPQERAVRPVADLPTLGLQIPPSLPQNHEPYSANTPRMRRLSNSSTWPAAPRPFASHNHSQSSGYPYSAPPVQFTAEDMAAALPPPPTSNQMNSLNKRISQGNPRRLSGGYQQIPRVPIGARSASAQHNYSSSLQHSYSPVNPIRRPSTAHVEPDQPLIISTPGGVSGAFDDPNQQSSMSQPVTPILAPIPRHPRPSQGSPLRPTVERLETIYSTASSQGRNQTIQSLPPPPPEPPHSILPSWLNRPVSSYSRTSPSVRRRRSRAERSAAKNMEDARKSGWSSSRKKNKKKTALDAASTMGWADESDPSPTKKKCVVM